jgi:hypothetical protein
MANKKFTDLDPAGANPTLVDSDILAVTLDPAGTPVSRKTSISNLMGKAPVQSVAGRTGAVTIANTDVSGLGTASTQDVGTANGNVVQLDATGLPAVDGSQLTNVSGSDSTKLAIANDLSDLNDAGTARTNLGLGTASTQDVGTADGNVVQLSDVGGTVKLPAVDGSQLTGLSANDSTKLAIANNLSDLNDAGTARTNLGLGTASTTNSSDYATASHTHAINDLSDVTITSASNEDVIKFNGTSFVNGQVSVDVDTPINEGLTTALRGTDNPHIGAFANQSFKVTDNPNKSVMVIADEDGNLEFLTKDGANVFVNTPSSRLALAKGFSIQSDSSEPDIEAVDTDGTTYSVISGDTDTKGANGLPTRQGFNLPDIGANPTPLLISGGTIA